MLQLVVAGYAIAYALLLVIGARIGDAFGRRRLFLAGMAGFTAASFLCGIALSIGALVVFRVVQGAAAAAMVPQVLSSIQATTTGQARARALGLWGAVGGIAMVSGQLLGGLLVSADVAGTEWRPIFLINVPVGLVGLLLARRAVPESRSEAPLPVDVAGTVLLAVALLSLLVPLTEGRSLGWPTWTLVMLGTFPLASAGFFVVERRVERAGRSPLVPLSLLAVPSMRRGLLMALPFFASFAGFMFAYALVLQDAVRLNPLMTGVSLVPLAGVFFVTSLSTASLVARFGRRVITVGAVLQTAGILGLMATFWWGWSTVSPIVLVPAMMLSGLGWGLVMTPLFRLVLSEVPIAYAGVGSGVLTTTQQTSLALGVATLGSLYLTWAVPTAMGPKSAMVWVLALVAVAAVFVAAVSRRLAN